MATETKTVSIDKEARKKKGLAHRRRGKETMASGASLQQAPLLNQTDVELISKEGESGKLVSAELVLGQMVLYQTKPGGDRSVVQEVALVPNLEVAAVEPSGLAVGGVTIMFVAAKVRDDWMRLIQTMVASKPESESKSNFTFSLCCVSHHF